jgi:hypothetical protein
LTWCEGGVGAASPSRSCGRRTVQEKAPPVSRRGRCSTRILDRPAISRNRRMPHTE